jgi:hypothetical protein
MVTDQKVKWRLSYAKGTDFGKFVGAQYSVTSPMGFNGAYYYAELTYNY